MPKSLHSILGTSNRVRKSSTKSNATRSTTTASPSSSPTKARKQPVKETDLFRERLEDHGISKLLAEDLSLRDVVQAMRYIRNKMFTPVPQTGFKSTRTAELLNYRASMAPIVTLGHLNVILASPTKVERETVELLGKGIVRKVRVERRGNAGEALIELRDLEAMLEESSSVSRETKTNFMLFLKANPTSQELSKTALDSDQTDELVRAGFLTSSVRATPGTTLHVRPEDRITLTSIHRVSQFASGTVSAVGGQNAIHMAGGGGGAPALTHSSVSSSEGAAFRISVPGHGRYLKLAEGAVDWIRDALSRTKWGEGPEDWLKERFEGGGLYGPRWKQFWGVEWEWAIGQAVGLGAVEVFETGSVGRGVRALAG